MDSVRGMEALTLVDDADILWTTCAGVLREQVSEAVWQTTFAGARAGAGRSTDVFVLAVPSTVVRERIEGRYLTLVNSALADAGGGSAAPGHRGPHRRLRARGLGSDDLLGDLGHPQRRPASCGQHARRPRRAGRTAASR